MPDDKYKDSSNGVLFDKFGLPPFSVLDSKQGYWVRRKKEWKDLGIKADGGRDSLKFLPSTETRPSWVRYNKESLKGKSNISIFDPVLTEVCYKWFCPKGGNILDPFTGGSVRGIVASQLGYRYTGFDIREEQIKANYNNLETLKFPVAKPNWIIDDAENVKDHYNEKCDLIFSCPPYHDLEKYSKMENDLSNMDYNEFRVKYKRIIKNCCDVLNDNRFAVFVVSEIRDKDGTYKNFVRDTIEAFEECGLQLFNEIVYLNQLGTLAMRTSENFINGRKVGKAHQNVICMYKGDVSKIQKLDITNNRFEPFLELLEKPDNFKVVYKREESKEKEMSEVENDFSQNPERQTGIEEKKEVVPEKGKLEATFGVPPFSILNTNQGYWKDRKKEWNSIGIESEVGRDARSYNIKEWVEEKGKSGGGSSQQERVLSDVSIFDPVLTELNYKWFCPPNGTILDPFAGGSVRGIVASALGYEYTGVDLRQEQVDANYENIDKLSIKLPIDPVWLQGDSTDIQNVGGEYDMIFSCPPYFDLEEYSKNPKDLSNMTYENFVKQYSLIIKNAVSMLKDNSFAVFVVGEIRDEDGFNRNFVGDTINAFMEAGMKFYNEGILYTSINTMSMRVSAQFTPYRKLGKVHQNVLVFYKAHSRKGTQRIFKLPECKFTPIKEMNIEPRERLKIIPTRSLDNIETKMRTKDIPCDICGYVSPTKEDYDTHLTGKWHMRAVERS